VLRLAPPLVIDEAEVESAVTILADALAAVTSRGAAAF
jgi:4-aminobutyrate aminotransferase-like enzyme